MTEGAEVFEKHVRNDGLFRQPREVLIHRLAMAAQFPGERFTPDLLEYRTGIFNTVLYIEKLNGVLFERVEDLGDVGPIVARVEKLTHQLIGGRKIPIAPELDFYQSGGCFGRRYNLKSIADNYRRTSQKLVREVEHVFCACASALDANEKLLAEADPVICHLDQHPKNFVLADGRMFLIDWGEGYVGRPGFDAGFFVMILLRSYGLPKFKEEATRFLQSYILETIPQPTRYLVPAMNRVFLPQSLWFLLRPDIVSRYEGRGESDAWREKILCLEEFAIGRAWQNIGL
ncbi:phosphotransferase family protein [Neorhizobium sp. DT-125]|uniref:phosphotransferase family protein n=1 Tax=Neorhizobium sp. DT-125 TaxID=3396163 RepID=UPI003F1BB85F